MVRTRPVRSTSDLHTKPTKENTQIRDSTASSADSEVAAAAIAQAIADHRKDTELEPLTSRSVLALKNLLRLGHAGSRRKLEHGIGWSDWPMGRRAAVMVALFAGKKGELNVLLTTRAKNLRVNPGEVALPGGKMDPTDPSLEHTARREAYEEIGLPESLDSVQHLCDLPPFYSRASNLLVTPVVFFLMDPNVKPLLNPSEVSSIFSHPLQSFLSDTPIPEAYVPYNVAHGTKPYRLQYDVRDRPEHGGREYRYFRFENVNAPIFGFTADICIHTAMLAYGKGPDYERKAPNQLSRKEIVRLALQQVIGDEKDGSRRSRL